MTELYADEIDWQDGPVQEIAQDLAMYRAMVQSALDGWAQAAREVERERDLKRQVLDEYRQFRERVLRQDGVRT